MAACLDTAKGRGSGGVRFVHLLTFDGNLAMPMEPSGRGDRQEGNSMNIMNMRWLFFFAMGAFVASCGGGGGASSGGGAGKAEQVRPAGSATVRQMRQADAARKEKPRAPRAIPNQTVPTQDIGQ